MNTTNTRVILAFKRGSHCPSSVWCCCGLWRCCTTTYVHVEPVFEYLCNEKDCKVCETTNSRYHYLTFYIDQKVTGLWVMNKHTVEQSPEKWTYVYLHKLNSAQALEFLNKLVYCDEKDQILRFNFEYWKNFMIPWKWFGTYGARHLGDATDYTKRRSWFCSEVVTAMLLQLHYAPEIFDDSNGVQPYNTSPARLYQLCKQLEDSHDELTQEDMIAHFAKQTKEHKINVNK